ncbi:MAG TPA: prenyltransferase/squalene oxidase repeat-containing protein [Candidatus Didemnitutus sp.]|nr:prenyltransferase/squalene oxidase repeat-containing protein [Candidatus Didemnitutus sp.]
MSRRVLLALIISLLLVQARADDPPDPSDPTPDAPATPASTDAAPAPAAPRIPAVTVEVRTVDPRVEGQDPTDPIQELKGWQPKIYVTGRAHMEGDDTFTFTVRLVADEVAGLPRGFTVVQPPMESDGERLGADNPAPSIALPLPRALLPGRYRVEAIGMDPPNLLVGSAPLTVSALAPADEFNLADPEFGALMDSVSGEDGAGLSWAPCLLQNGNSRAWKPMPRPEAPADSESPELPSDLVVSFFQHQSALVARVELTATSPDTLPLEIEVWGANENTTAGYTKLGGGVAEDGQEKLTVAVPPTSVKFLKVRLLSRSNGNELALVGLRILEGTAPGYSPLRTRFPAITDWRVQPRHAAQQGLYYLSASAADFQIRSDCLGCHVQSQAMMGISIAAQNDYVISRATQRLLNDYARRSQNEEGDIARSPQHNEHEEATNTLFAALALEYGPRQPEDLAAIAKAGAWLAARQNEDGSVASSDQRNPVTQGAILHTSHAIEIWARGLASGPNAALSGALAKALDFVTHAEAATTQDSVFKALTLLRHGDDAGKKQARQICVNLLSRQLGDGGWPLEGEDDPTSSDFATGEVLYTLRQAGFSIGSPAFQRGVRFLIYQQQADGSWQERPEATPFGSTMWPVIALAGSFTTKIEPAHLAVTALPRPAPLPSPAPKPVVAATGPASSLPRNLELILDCSGSMNEYLGRSTRIATAKDVMRAVLAKLPNDLNVGLRLYGHRYSGFSSKSNTDTELVVPIGPMNRAALGKVIDGAKARGETPLVLSALQAGEDLKKIGGGAIVLVTDGEESCGGDPRKAGPQLAALGVPVRLDIIGFTLTGRRIAADMQFFAGATGGRFYTAADGLQLANALVAATASAPRPPPPPVVATVPTLLPPEDFPYEILDAAGSKVASGSTLNLNAPELEPGTYRVVLHDGAKVATAEGVKLDAAQTIELRYDPASGKLAIAQ